MQRVIYCTCLLGEGTHSREGEAVNFSMPVTACILWEDGQGQLHGGSTEIEAGGGVPGFGGLQVPALCRGPPCGSVHGRRRGRASSDRYSGGGFLWRKPYDRAAGRGIGRRRNGRRGDPDLVIRRIRPAETLWDAAKAAGTTQEAIMEANGLSEDQQPQGMLLIPRGR